MRLSLSDPWLNGAPIAGTPIDWCSDHADGLVGFWPCWDGRSEDSPNLFLEELVAGRHATSNTSLVASGSGMKWTNGPDYPVPFFNGNSAAAIQPTFPAVFDLPQFTVCLRLKLKAKNTTYGGVVTNRVSGLHWFQLTSESTPGTTWQPHFVTLGTTLNETHNLKIATSFPVPFTDFLSMVFTYDGTNVRYFADGIEYAVVSSGDSGFTPNGTTFWIGFQPISGSLYDVRFYNRARPELGTELYDPSTRWKVFQSARATIRAVSSSGLVGSENMFGGFVNMPGGFVNG